MTVTDSTSASTAQLVYTTASDGQELYTYTYARDDGVAQTNAVDDPHEVQVHNLRPLAEAGKLSLDNNGFELRTLQHPTIKNWDEASEVEGQYYPEVSALIKEVTGASRVFIFDHTLRRNLAKILNNPGVDAMGLGPKKRAPVHRVHVDYTLQSGPKRVQELLPDEADTLLQGRFAVVQVWKPLDAPVLELPLAIADATTVPQDDLMQNSLIYPDRKGNVYFARYNPGHKWYYAPEMQPNEALVFKCYDSREGGTRFVPHTAFNDPKSPPNAPPRESIEIRALVFF